MRASSGASPSGPSSLSVLGEEGPLVVFIHGIGGVGKSALVEAFTAEARARGAIVLRLDSGTIEPTPRGFLAAISSATGGDLDDRRGCRGAAREPRRSGRPRPRSLRGPAPARPLAPADLRSAPCRTTRASSSPAAKPRWRAGRWAWVACSGACRSATCRATTPRRSSARRASTATTSSGSTGSPAAIRCRCASPRRRSSPARTSITRRRPSPRSSRS